MYCWQCGKELSDKAILCPACGVRTYPTTEPSLPESDAALGMILPLDRSPYAIIAGYLGLFSVLLIFAPLSLLFGILAIRDMRRRPERHGRGRAYFGIVMGGLFTLIGFLSVIAAIGTS